MVGLNFTVYTLLEWERDIPGVWPNKFGGGGRIPFNAAQTLGRSAFCPDEYGGASVEVILRSAAFLPWVNDMVMPHQRAIAGLALSREGFHAWSPAGSGKTLIGLIVLAGAKKGPKVVVTKAAARGTWKEEIRKFTRFKPVVLKGIKDIQEIDHDPSCIYITAWETLIAWEDALVALKPHTLVMDEIHCAKNHKRSKAILLPDGSRRYDRLGNTAAAIKTICKASKRRFGMTATPIPNRTKDLWAQLDLVEPWQWGSFHQFGERYCAGYKDDYGWKYDGTSNEVELLERLDWSRYKANQQTIAATLPAKRRQVVYLSRDEQNNPSGFKAAIKSARFDKHMLFETMLAEAASRKRDYVLERVMSALHSGQKVVVFTGRRKDCDTLGDRIARAIKGAKLNVPLFCAHGGTSSEDRDVIRHEYMTVEGAACLVGTGDAWGESVNLQDTDLALFVMLPWTPRSIAQWEGRFARLGQKRPVLISYIIAEGTVDEHVADVLLDKLPAVGKIAEDTEIDKVEAAFEGDKAGLLDRVANFI